MQKVNQPQVVTYRHLWPIYAFTLSSTTSFLSGCKNYFASILRSHVCGVWLLAGNRFNFDFSPLSKSPAPEVYHLQDIMSPEQIRKRTEAVQLESSGYNVQAMVGLFRSWLPHEQTWLQIRSIWLHGSFVPFVLFSFLALYCFISVLQFAKADLFSNVSVWQQTALWLSDWKTKKLNFHFSFVLFLRLKIKCLWFWFACCVVLLNGSFSGFFQCVSFVLCFSWSCFCLCLSVADIVNFLPTYWAGFRSCW